MPTVLCGARPLSCRHDRRPPAPTPAPVPPHTTLADAQRHVQGHGDGAPRHRVHRDRPRLPARHHAGGRPHQAALRAAARRRFGAAGRDPGQHGRRAVRRREGEAWSASRSTPTTCAACATAWSPAPRGRCTSAPAPRSGKSASRTQRGRLVCISRLTLAVVPRLAPACRAPAAGASRSRAIRRAYAASSRSAASRHVALAVPESALRYRFRP